MLTNDRLNKRGGGVAAYIRSDLNPKIIYASPGDCDDKPEMLFVEICVSFQKCILCVVYQPPKISGIADIESSLLDVITDYEHVIVMGDFNTNLLASTTTSTKQLMTMFQALGLAILPLEPTHHTQFSDSLLDLIVTNKPDRVITHGQCAATGISAHDMIYLTYSLKCPKTKSKL